MNVGQVVGYALLGLVDAFVPALVMTFAVLTLFEVWSLAAYAGMTALAVGFLLGAVSAARDGRPFPLTRGFKYVFLRFWWV